MCEVLYERIERDNHRIKMEDRFSNREQFSAFKNRFKNLRQVTNCNSETGVIMQISWK